MAPLALGFIEAVNAVVFGYFLLINGIYLIITVVGFRALDRHARRTDVEGHAERRRRRAAPPMSVLVPTHNEEDRAVEMVRALLRHDYPRLDVILVDDGSTDQTVHRLCNAFGFVPSARPRMAELECVPVEAVWTSPEHPELTLLTRENGGKADAQNAALNYCRTPLFCVIDGDTLLEPDALLRMALPFLEDRSTVAAGGTIRILNGCDTEDGVVRNVCLPRRLLPRFQVLEYLRAFLVGRTGWAHLDMLLIVSGAFGVFRRDMVVQAGGFRRGAIGEDMELVVRLHVTCKESGVPCRIAFVPDPVAWTEVPETVGALFRQRVRWHRGLVQSLSLHRRAFLRRDYGRIGLVAFPYYGIIERWGPLVELVGYAAFILAAFLGLLSVPFALAFIGVAIGLGGFLSITVLVMEELWFRRYRRWADLFRLLLLAMVENLGYRQLLAVARARGLLAEIRGEPRIW